MSEQIWVVSELYYPEDTSTGHFMTGIAEGLAEHAEVGVLCSQPTYAARGLHAPWIEGRRGVNIRRCWGTRLNKDVLLFRLLNLLTISLALFWGGLRHFPRAAKVLVVTNPPLLPFLITVACRLKRATPVLLVHDVYPEVLVAAGMVRQGSRGFRLMQACTRWLYRQAARVVVLGRDMERLAAAKGAAQKTRIIPNWADLDEVRPEASRADNALLIERGLQAAFVVQYCGNMGRTHGLEYLLEAAARAAPATHFLLTGSGARQSWVEHEIPARGLQNVTVLPRCPRERLSACLNACDLALISFVPGMSGVSVPSRMYNIMAAGKPILAVAEADSELAAVIGEELIGWVVAPGDIDGILQAIAEARADPRLLSEMGRRARRAAEAKYSLPRVLGLYRDLFAAL